MTVFGASKELCLRCTEHDQRSATRHSDADSAQQSSVERDLNTTLNSATDAVTLWLLLRGIITMKMGRVKESALLLSLVETIHVCCLMPPLKTRLFIPFSDASQDKQHSKLPFCVGVAEFYKTQLTLEFNCRENAFTASYCLLLHLCTLYVIFCNYEQEAARHLETAERFLRQSKQSYISTVYLRYTQVQNCLILGVFRLTSSVFALQRLLQKVQKAAK